MSHQSGAIAHLYISDPKGAKKTIAVGEVPPQAGKISGLLATHPPVEQRIKALVG
jgi:Zn-dependent protease with chaperone function